MKGEQMPAGVGLPGFGWVARTPLLPTVFCRWCGTAWNYLHGVRVCVRCDVADRVNTTLEERPTV